MKERLAGLLLPPFSPRREGDLGIGDTRGLREWIDLAADHGVGFLQLLPINEAGGFDSPYDAISAVALEPAYLTCEEIPGITAAALAAARLRLKRGAAVDYRSVKRTKRELLEQAWSAWSKAGKRLKAEFRAFRKAEAAWLPDYAVFRTLVEAAGTEVWESWPKAWRSPAGARKAAAGRDDRVEFFTWVQWLCFRQWRALRRYAGSRGVKLMGDIPIGVSRCSADVFFGRADFDLKWCGGAPPETMFKHDEFIRRWGQNWGIPLYRWKRMERADFPWWRRRIDRLTDVFHIFRIDHILGFYRIYSFPWQPQRNHEFLSLTEKRALRKAGGHLPRWAPRPDDTPAHCAANRADGDRRLKMVLRAAGQAAVVGEDLGCVPDYVRPHLDSLGIAGFRVPHWDADDDGRVVPGSKLPECSFATYATHDHEPLPVLWEHLWNQSRNRKADKEDRMRAAAELRRLADFGGIDKVGPFDDEVQWRLIDALMACRSRFAAIQITELFGMLERINYPGTVGQQNWTFRLPFTAAECRDHPAWKRLKKSIRSGRRGISKGK